MKALKTLFLLASLLISTPSTAGDDAPTFSVGGNEAEGQLGSETASLSFIRHGQQSPNRDSGVRLSGDMYIDTGYMRLMRGLESQVDSEQYRQDGRFLLRVTPTMNSGSFFFKASAEVLAHVNEIYQQENIDTDDAWLKFGEWDSWDIQFGRFEAWEVYHKGQGLERDTEEDKGAFDQERTAKLLDIYEVNYAYYRQDGFGQVAAHFYPSDWLRFEISGVYGNERKSNAYGVRPAGIVDGGWIKLKLAGEWVKSENEDLDGEGWDEKRGFGGSLQFFFDENTSTPLQFGFNGAYGLVDVVDVTGKVNEKGSVDPLSLGAYLNLGISTASLGFGYNYTRIRDRQYNDQTGKRGIMVHHQGYASIKHSIFVPQATAKLVGAYARADINPAFENSRTNEMYSVRLRLLYSY
jgi:hypothetical protein